MSNELNSSEISNEKKYELVVSILHDLNAHFYNWIKSLLIINSSLCVAVYALVNKYISHDKNIFLFMSILTSLFGVIITYYVKEFIIKNREWHNSYLQDLCLLEKNNPIVFVKDKTVGGQNIINSLKHKMGNLCNLIILLWLLFIQAIIIFFQCSIN
ncbi:MAG: hypothetical protein OEV64_01975 [Desulfobulbaceae bacterium]|nr:hypothetical protein [Desulfobulbaceae bacterium]